MVKQKQALLLLILTLSTFIVGTLCDNANTKGWEGVGDGWYCQPGDYSDYKSREQASYGLVLTPDNLFSQCVLNTATVISPKVILGCQIYDSNYNCLECDCDKGLSWDKKSCLDNYNRIPYCQRYNSTEQCQECKFTYNEDVVQKNNPNTKTVFDKMDYGLYQGQCYNNQDSGNIPKCRVYDDSNPLSSTSCNTCHFKPYWFATSTGLNYYTKIDQTPGFYLYRYFLYKATSDAARITCAQLPETYESKLDSLKYLTSTSGLTTTEAQTAYICQDGFAHVSSYLDTKNGFKNFTTQLSQPIDGCSSIFNTKYYIRNGCYKVNSKKSDLSECLTEYKNITATGSSMFTIRAYSELNLYRMDQDNLMCSTCADNTLQFDSTYQQCILKNIDNCDTYNLTTDSYVCTKCKSNFTLSNENKCVNEIINCLTYTPDGKNCTKCKTLYAVSYDYQSCILQEDVNRLIKTIPAGAYGCTKVGDDQSETCFSCDDSIGFNLDGKDKQQCYCGPASTFLDNPAVKQICTKIDTTAVRECRYQFMVDKVFGKSRYNCTDCLKSFDWQFCAGVTSTITNNCAAFIPGSDSKWCGLCKDRNFTINDQGQCVDSRTENDLMNSGISNCEQVEYYINQLPDDPYVNCIAKDSNGVCIQCIDGYGLNKNFTLGVTLNRTCVQNLYLLTQNCTQIDNSDANKCSKCKPGFYLNANKLGCTQIEVAVDKCLAYDANKNCTSCQKNYGLADNLTACILPDNCIYANPAKGKQCQICATGYILNYDGICYNYITLNNCAVYNTDLVCTKCQTGYGFHYSDGYKQCLKLDNCVTPDSYKQDICTKCTDLYYSDNGICKQGTDTNCKIYNSTTNVCITCNVQYYFDSSSSKCKQQDNQASNHCYDPKDNTKCKQCSEMYYLKDDNTCDKVDQKNVNYCLELDSTSKITDLNCKKCQSGYTRVSATSCVKNADVSTKINGCSEYSQTNSSICTKCDDTHVLASSKCETNTTKKTNCSTYDDATDKCTECKDKYQNYLDNGTCKFNDTFKSNCKELIQDPKDSYKGYCGFCNLDQPSNKFYQFDTDNKCNIAFNPVSNPDNNTYCIKRDTNNTCTNCIPGYIFQASNNTCQKSTKDALEYCITQVAKDDSGDKCTLCYDYVYQYLDSNVCKQRTTGSDTIYTTNCKNRSETSKGCNSCVSPYGLKSGTNKSCEASADALCDITNIDDQTKCSACKNDNQFSDNTCKAKTDDVFFTITNCDNYTQTACNSCKSSTFYNTAQLKCDSTSISSCDTQDPKNVTNCKQCGSKHYWVSNTGTCTSTNTVINCKYYTDAATCNTCEDNYVLTDNKCQKPSNCQKALSTDATICETCNNDVKYQKNGGKECVATQVLYVTGCQTYDSAMKCNSCWSNFGLNSSQASCVNSVTDSKCLQVLSTNGTICGLCVDYAYLKDGICTKLTTAQPNCLQHSDDNYCSKCKDGYTLSSGACTAKPNCLKLSGSDCTICEPPYLVYSGNCVLPFTMSTPVYQVDNYKMYKYCSLCADGYTINKMAFPSDGTGQQCVKDTPSNLQDTNCVEYNQYKICKKCKDNYTLIRDIYNQTYCVDEQPSDFLLCDYYEPMASYVILHPVCLICRNSTLIGLNVVTNKCQQIANDDASTIVVRYLSDSNWNRMVLQCATDYVYDMVEGKCISQTGFPHCLAKKSGNCVDCDKDQDYGLVYVNNTFYCTVNDQVELPTLHCVAYNKVTTEEAKKTAVCNECQFGYYLSGGVCKQSIVGCIAYAWFQTKTDPKKIFCTKCQPKYRVNPQTGSCESYTNQMTSIGCNLINLNGDCLYCIGPYLLQSGKCYLKVPSCLIQTLDQCTECLSGFVLNSEANECVANQQGCAIYKNGKCTQCKANCPNTQYNLKQFSNFKVWNWQYFGMDNNGRCQEGCVHFDGNNNCDQCANYVDYDCNRTIQNSDVYKLQLYYLSNSRCLRRKNFVKYCVTYDTKTDNCLNCIPAYYANYTADSQIYVSKCTYCNNNSLAFGTDQACNLNTNDCKCQSCVKPLKSYYDVVKWICTARQQINCLEYSANEDKCTSCNHYFVLTKDGKCIQNNLCYDWDNSEPQTEKRVCLRCNPDQSEGEYHDANNNNALWCVNQLSENKYQSYFQQYCATYVNDTETPVNIVCSTCFQKYGLKYFTLVNIEDTVGSSVYKLKCSQQQRVGSNTVYPGCKSYLTEDSITCKTPDRPSDNCPKVKIADFQKMDCQGCYYFSKQEQFGLQYDSSKNQHYCIKPGDANSVAGCQMYDETTINKCQICWYDYQKRSGDNNPVANFEEAVSSCEYVKTYCKNIGCQLLKLVANREWPQCKVCADYYDINEGNQWCDLVNINGVDGGGVPQQSDDGTGLDGGLTPLPKTPPKPTPKYGKFLTISLEVLLLVALGIFAFLL